MNHYDLTEEAAEDIRKIARYTLKAWGAGQVERYRHALKSCLDRLAQAPALGRAVSPTLPEVRLFPCQHHYVFYLSEGRVRPLVIAVLHERQDFQAKLGERLEF